MKFNRRSFVISFITLVIILFMAGYPLPYYISTPGGADPLNPVVEVENGYESKGDMHLVTVRGGRATPFQYLWASLRPYHLIQPIDEVFPKGITDEDYRAIQLQMMESSQQASTVVAYEAAGADINIEFNGVYVVNVIDNMPAEGLLEQEDKIIKIDNQLIENTDQLIDYVSTKEPGSSVSVTVERGKKEVTEEIVLEKFPGEEKVGMGIQLVTNRDVKVNPPVAFSSGDIGGPSAGLMFSLEIYDQLTEEDLTKGYQIAGTGEINYEGQVGRIGGIDKKVVAADKEGCDIFFAPNEGGAENSNYNEAAKTAKEIDTDMEIVPVDTFEDALTHLQNLQPKE